MPANADDALKALEAGLAGKPAPAQKEETEEVIPPTDEDTNTSDDEAAEEPAENEDEEGAEGEESSEESDGSDDEEAAEEPAQDEEDSETPEQKAAREKAEKAAERGTGDILEDPIPKDLSTRTQARMTKLIDRVKELQPDAEVGRELIQHIEASQMTADEFSMALTFGRLKHSDDVEDNRKAYQILWAGLKELAPLVGETLPGVDPLEGHPDLATRVAAKTLDAKDAAEIAAGRNRRKADTAAAQRAQQNTQTAQQRAQQTQRLEAQTRQELNDLGAQLSRDDPNFEAKMKAMTAEQKAKIQKTPAGLRVNAFLKTYLALKVPAKVAAPVQKQKQQPLRAGKVPAAGGSGVRREAGSAVDAIDIALGLK